MYRRNAVMLSPESDVVALMKYNTRPLLTSGHVY